MCPSPTDRPTGVLVANKSDMQDVAEVKDADGKAAAEELGLAFVSCSVMDGVNVDNAFSKIAQQFHERHSAGSKDE